MRRRGLLIVILALACLAPESAVATGAGPVAAYIKNNGTVAVVSPVGPVTTLPALSTFSLDGGVVVGASGSGLEGYDAVTGTMIWNDVKNGFQPILTDRGRKVVFWPDTGGVRDPQVNSVWMRGRNGKVRKLVQFSNGPGLPGYDPGFDGEAGLLSTSVDNAGDTVVVAEGNDVDLFIYDVFAVDRATKHVTRLTSGKKSRWPSISPNGNRVVYQRDVEECGAAFVRATRLLVVRPDATDRHELADGSCDAWFHNARWVSNKKVVAYRTKFDGNDYTTSLFLINVNTGKRKKLLKANDIVFFSAAKDRVGYVRDSRGGWFLLDLDTRTRTHFNGYIPHLRGDHNTI